MLSAEFKAALAHLCGDEGLPGWFTGMATSFCSRCCTVLTEALSSKGVRLHFSLVANMNGLRRALRRLILSVAGVATLGLPERGQEAVKPVSWWSLMILETVLFACFFK